MIEFCPIILGQGRAGRAMERALLLTQVIEPEWKFQPIEWLKRGSDVRKFSRPNALLFIATPHALHAPIVLAANEAQFPLIFCEKPLAVSRSQLEALKNIQSRIAVFHGYRQMWGPQEIRRMIDTGELGEIISIEGSYWQSSATRTPSAQTWKDAPALAGEFDALLDIGSHWIDLALFFAKAPPKKRLIWLSYKNAASRFRDTHAQVHLTFDGGMTAFGSVSKTVHGSTNDLNISVIGTKQAVTWKMQDPDKIFVGEKSEVRVIARKTSDLGTCLPPFHGAGWLEGYVEIIRQAIRDLKGQNFSEYPNLSSSTLTLKTIFEAEIVRL